MNKFDNLPVEIREEAQKFLGVPYTQEKLSEDLLGVILKDMIFGTIL